MSLNFTASECLWCNQTLSAVVIQAAYLSIVAVVGVLGNLLVIFSLAFGKCVNKNGNMFLINLALADLIVTGVCIPAVAANVLNNGKNTVPPNACNFLSFILVCCCVCSLNNLLAIAVNRYLVVGHQDKYISLFRKRNVRIMVVLIWVWTFLISLPTVTGWSSLKYDEKASICTWEDEKPKSFSIFLISIAVFLPMMGIIFCYYKLYKTFQLRSKNCRRMSILSTVNGQCERRLKIELGLMRTLLITTGFSLVFWMPYGITIVYGPEYATPVHKKIVGWLAITNSSMNFIIYGVTNPVYRHKYKKFLEKLLCCKEESKSGSSRSLSRTASHKSFTYQINQQKPSPTMSARLPRRLTRTSTRSMAVPRSRSVDNIYAC